MNVSIIGTGIYGIAIALNIARNNHNIKMWSENKELIDNFQKNHNFKPLTDTKIPKNIIVTNDIKEAIKDTELIIIATTAKYVRSVCDAMKPISKNIPICIASKGVENETCSFLSDIVFDILKSSRSRQGVEITNLIIGLNEVFHSLVFQYTWEFLAFGKE